MKKTKVGFDFDRVFVDYPPFIPDSLIDYLYKKKNHKLSYRIPGNLERQVRILSHYSLFRPPLKENVSAIKRIFENKNIETYVVSSRFSFLKKRTEEWNKRNELPKYFKKMYFNFNDKQPHIFKEEILREEKIEKFIDDDLDLLTYLSGRNPKIKFYWINPHKSADKLPENIIHIRNLDEFIKKYV